MMYARASAPPGVPSSRPSISSAASAETRRWISACCRSACWLGSIPGMPAPLPDELGFGSVPLLLHARATATPVQSDLFMTTTLGKKIRDRPRGPPTDLEEEE